jgi:hypothetical protein
MLYTLSSALVNKGALRYVIYSYSLIYALNVLYFNIRDSKLYISFSISLLALL